MTRFAPLALLLATLILLAGWLSERTGSAPVAEEETAAAFDSGFDAMANRYGEAGGAVRPPPGDVFLRARRWEFRPALELEPGGTYRLHLLSEDVVHSAVIGETEVLLVPGMVAVVSLVAPTTGRVRIQCGEYCGLGHTKMIGSIAVVR